jgi:ethanolamine permease
MSEAQPPLDEDVVSGEPVKEMVLDTPVYEIGSNMVEIWPERDMPNDIAFPSYQANKYQLLCLALVCSLCNMYSSWNAGLIAGVGYEIVFSILSAITFGLYCCCASELTSAFPFPGGSYGLARCTVGFFPGFLTGCIEVFYYALSLGLHNASIVEFINLAYPNTTNQAIVIILCLFGLQIGICYSKHVFWWSIVIIAVVALAINFSYLFGSMQYANFDQWAYTVHGREDDYSTTAIIVDDYASRNSTAAEVPMAPTLFVGKGFEIFSVVPACIWQFMGSELVNLACDDAKKPRTHIPFALLGGFGYLVIFSVLVPILGSSLGPGPAKLVNLLTPAAPGFAQIFKISRRQSLMLQVVGLFGFSTAVLYALSKLLASMADSKLLPKALGVRTVSTQVPVRALFTGSIFSIITLIVPLLGGRALVLLYPNIIVLCTALTYNIQMVGYIVLKLKLRQFKREFTSPFGVIGAVIVMLMCSLAGICCIAFHSGGITTAIVIAAFIGMVSALYWFYSRHRQTFSNTEKLVMLPAHAEIRNVNGKSHITLVDLVLQLTEYLLVYRIFVPTLRRFGETDDLLVSSPPSREGAGRGFSFHFVVGSGL